MLAKNSKVKTILVACAAILAISIFCVWENNAITTTQIQYVNPKIPEEFNGYRIVHISDLHNKLFGKAQERLLEKIRAVSPDIIVITGDLIDRRKFDLETAMVFVRGAVKIAPVYYVSGNHEAWSGAYSNISQALKSSGVHVLDDTKTTLVKGKGKIEILGLSDPDFLRYSYLDGTNTSKLKEHLERLSDDAIFQILLCHRPELFDIYVRENLDLIFSGHAHGGQVRIPFVGGLVAPDQGLFPKYTAGAYTKNQSTLIVSRGLGNSIIPIRIFNRPEIVVVTLRSE